MEFEIVENPYKTFSTLKRNEIDDVKIAEIYWTENNNTDLDFVILFFNYNKQNQKLISELIDEYHVKNAGCIIGSMDCTGNTDYEDFSSLMNQFDLHLDSATSVDFENLIEFCSLTKTGYTHFLMSDFKSAPGTEIYIVKEESYSISELLGLVSESCRKLFSHREKKFPKVMIAFQPNGYELELDEFKELLDSLDDYITGDRYMMFMNDEVSEQVEEVIKVSLIFCEKD